MEYFEVTKKSKGFDGVMHVVRLSEALSCPNVMKFPSYRTNQPINLWNNKIGLYSARFRVEVLIE